MKKSTQDKLALVGKGLIGKSCIVERETKDIYLRCWILEKEELYKRAGKKGNDESLGQEEREKAATAMRQIKDSMHLGKEEQMDPSATY